jgi:hypothetical protein
MATETNKNISYSSILDFMKRKKIVTDTNTKNNLKNKINLFLNAVKVKHS